MIDESGRSAGRVEALVEEHLLAAEEPGTPAFGLTSHVALTCAWQRALFEHEVQIGRQVDQPLGPIRLRIEWSWLVGPKVVAAGGEEQHHERERALHGEKL